MRETIAREALERYEKALRRIAGKMCLEHRDHGSAGVRCVDRDVSAVNRTRKETRPAAWLCASCLAVIALRNEGLDVELNQSFRN